jgi:hypothetical protein
VGKYVSSRRGDEVVEVVDTVRGIYDVVPVYEGLVRGPASTSLDLHW